MTEKYRTILRNALRQILSEIHTSFEGVTDQIERSANLVKELGGLQAAEITDLDRARISDLVERQVALGVARGDFDFVFRKNAAPQQVPEFQIAKLDLGPNDILVIKAERALTYEARTRVEAIARSVFPLPRKVIVLEDGLDISTIREGQ